jgi:hypothetical protein
MPASRVFFLTLSLLIGVVGLLAAAWAEDYLHGFGLALLGFALFFAGHTVKRHFDEQEGH